MSHFYRLFSFNLDNSRLLKKCGYDHVDTFLPGGGDWTGMPGEWWRALDRDEIPLDPPWPHCRMLRAPCLLPQFGPAPAPLFRMRPGAALPDLWAASQFVLVSARAVLEPFNDFDHEFIETAVLDADSQQHIPTAVPYYLLNVRRILQIEQLGPYGAIDNEDAMFSPWGQENEFLPVVQRTPVLKEQLSQLPLWRQYGQWEVLYLSEAVMQALRAANLTGIDPYSTYYGKAGEAVARFE